MLFHALSLSIVANARCTNGRRNLKPSFCLDPLNKHQNMANTPFEQTRWHFYDSRLLYFPILTLHSSTCTDGSPANKLCGVQQGGLYYTDVYWFPLCKSTNFKLRPELSTKSLRSSCSDWTYVWMSSLFKRPFRSVQCTKFSSITKKGNYSSCLVRKYYILLSLSRRFFSLSA